MKRHSFRTWGFPLLAIVCCPPVIILLWMIAVHYNGSLREFERTITWQHFADQLPLPSLAAAKILAVWALLQIVLLLGLPGKQYSGPVTPMGNRPRYKLNGVAAFIVTHIVLWLGSYRFGFFSPAIIYDRFGELLSTIVIFAPMFCGLLYLKGLYYPSTTDTSRSGNVIWDYYWGLELHPALSGISLKQLIVCRFSMMGWSVILFSFLAKQYELHGHVSNAMWLSVALQVLYVFKFFVWEAGYFASLDMMHDRFGFYICWGVMAWVPGVYPFVGLYLVRHPINLSATVVMVIAALGFASLWMNYSADAQRQKIRATDGRAKIWGRKPEIVRAKYATADGVEHESILLASGYWGIARHFHYVPEILLGLSWTLPALFDHALPYFYVVYLTILLVDRSRRDDLRCRQKYGEYWSRYCAIARYKIIPGLY